MKLQTILEPVEASPPETQTQPLRRSGGWTPFALPRIGLHLHSDGEQLLLANRTAISWVIYRKFHRLGVIDADETLLLSLPKYGSLSVRPHATNDNAEFLVLPLHHAVQRVVIYRHAMGVNMQIYDMKGIQSKAYSSIDNTKSCCRCVLFSREGLAASSEYGKDSHHMAVLGDGLVVWRVPGLYLRMANYECKDSGNA